MKLCLVRDSTILVAGLVLASMLGTTARADIRIDERYTVDALGGMSVASEPPAQIVPIARYLS